MTYTGISEKYKTTCLENAIKLQERMMVVLEELRFDNEDEEDDEEDCEDDDENPAQSEIATLLEVYKTVTKDIKIVESWQLHPPGSQPTILKD